MFVVNKKHILLILGIIVIILSINIEKCESVGSNGVIREENFVSRKLKQDKGNSNQKKEYTNKEVVFGLDDDDDEDEDLKQKLGDTLNLHQKPVQRSQRIDFKNVKHHDEHKLKSFHNNKNLQKAYLHKHDNDYNLNYDLIIDEILQNSDLFEDVMKMKDIGTSIGKTKYNDLDQENMPVEELVNNNKFKNSHKFKNYDKKKIITNKKLEATNIQNYDVKENNLPENEYFKQFLHESKLENVLLKDLNFESTKPIVASPVNSNPALINKQSNPSIQDPIMDAKIDQLKQQNDYLFIFVVAGCTIAGVIALLAAGVCWYTVFRARAIDGNYGTPIGKLSQSSVKSCSIKSCSTSSGDRRLAQSAQMYHYQHQKQQMIAMEKANNETKPENSDNSEGETEEGDYTVYECPGLAPTGEMEVKNPLFKEDFSASSQNIYQPTLPPSYSTLTQPVIDPVKTEQLIELDEKKEDLTEPKPADSVTIPIQETNPTSQN